MKIRQTDQACLNISFSSPFEKRKKVEVTIDPLEETKALKIKSDILILTGTNGSNAKIGKDSFVVQGPGEYEIRGVFTRGIATENGLVMYALEGDNMKSCYLGVFGQKTLSVEQLEKIGSIDILIVPVNKTSKLTPKETMSIVSQIEPEIILFIKHGLGKTKKSEEKVREFLKEMGIKSLEEVSELEIKKVDLKGEGRRMILLT